MQISLADIDPEVARRVAESPRFGEEVEAVAKAERGRRNGLAVKEALGTVGTEVCAFLVGGALLGPDSPTAAYAVFFAVVLGTPVAGALWYLRRAGPRIRSAAAWRRAPFGASGWRAFTAPLNFTGAQKSYADAIDALLEAAAAGRLQEQQARSLLAELNGLAESDRTLLEQQQDLARLTTAEDPERLARERESLATRCDAAADPAARSALGQSLALLDERIAHARELSPLCERVEAQREVVAQTLASFAGALLRLKVAPQVADSSAPATEAERAAETAHGIVQQTRAVEQAVAEVVALRTGGG